MLIKRFLFLAFLLSFAFQIQAQENGSKGSNGPNGPNGSTNPKKSLERLMAGNRRYVNGNATCRNDVSEVRIALAKGQNPFAVIVGCSDSRVPPEIVFDQGVGDLFIARVAGNVVDSLIQDSIEYSVVHLGSSIIMVLGHERCGAVQAVVENQTADIEEVAALIGPAVEATKDLPGNRVENATLENVRLMVEQIKRSPVIARYIEQGKVDVVGGFYRFSDGRVTLVNWNGISRTNF